MPTKAELRSQISTARGALSRQEVSALSARIEETLLRLPEIERAQSVFAYVSFGNEVETHGLLRRLLADGKTLLVPRIVARGIMEAHRLERLEDLRRGAFGILTPGTPDPFGGTPEVSLCPGVAFSLRGDRLGRGEAYYDRFLGEHPGTFAVGLAFELQILDELPSEPGDRRVDLVVTERRILRPPS